jgi:hypothetical protein
MCIYCDTNNYRKIYENHHGPIGKDLSGRRLEVHHIDGNHSNNNPSNLMLLTLQEHYNTHFEQKDYAACALISRRLNMSPEVMSELVTLDNQIRVANGTHHLLKRKDGTSHASDRAKLGTLPTQISSKNGTHNWLGNKGPGPGRNQMLLSTGRHASQIKVSCLCCHQTTTVNSFARNHLKMCYKQKNSNPA